MRESNPARAVDGQSSSNHGNLSSSHSSYCIVASEGLQLRMLELNQLFLAYEANEITVSLIRNYDCVLDTPEFLPLE